MRNQNKQTGFTLVELLVSVAVFAIVATGVYNAFEAVYAGITNSRLRLVATLTGSERLEYIKNMSYDNIDIVTSTPLGKIERVVRLERGGYQFDVTTTIRGLDDPFDGVSGGTPTDTSSIDYKLVQVDVACVTCKLTAPISLSTRVAPKAKETAVSGGGLEMKTIDANGRDVPLVNIEVVYNDGTGDRTIYDTTGVTGVLKLVGLPVGVDKYSIKATKTGYSPDRTYKRGDVANPNPIKPDATIETDKVTLVSFAVDRESTLNVKTLTDSCAAVPSAAFKLTGDKKIGTSPDVLRYDVSHTTDATGEKSISGLAWDSYTVSMTDSRYDLAGSLPLTYLSLLPGAVQDISLILAPKNPKSLLVLVKDASTGLPVSGASALLSKAPFSETKTTGRGAVSQTNWEGGGGQANFSDNTKYYSSDGNVDTTTVLGAVTLLKPLSIYNPSGYLVSSTFDAGSSATFHNISWTSSIPAQISADSVKFQLAANNDNATWSFTGPDGTSGSYYTSSGQAIASGLAGNRYLRYKVYFETSDTAYTPTLSDVALTFSSACSPAGEVYWSELLLGTYELDVTHPDYVTASETVNVDDDSNQHDILLQHK